MRSNLNQTSNSERFPPLLPFLSFLSLSGCSDRVNIGLGRWKEEVLLDSSIRQELPKSTHLLSNDNPQNVDPLSLLPRVHLHFNKYFSNALIIFGLTRYIKLSNFQCLFFMAQRLWIRFLDKILWFYSQKFRIYSQFSFVRKCSVGTVSCLVSYFFIFSTLW